MIRMRLIVIGAALWTVVCMGCSRPPDVELLAQQAEDVDPEVEARRAARADALRKLENLERVPPPAAPVRGEVPAAIIDPLLSEVAGLVGVAREAIGVERAEFVVWASAALGCPEPGQVYTQAPVRGYHVVLVAGDRRFDYRVTETGQARRCHTDAAD